MSIARFNTLTRGGAPVIESADNGEFVFYSTHAYELTVMRLRAERAEHFVRIIAGLRPGNIGETEAGQLVRTAQATLQPITPKGTL